MLDANPLLSPTVYFRIWDESCARHPRSAPDYCWKAHLRDLCRACRELVEHPEHPEHAGIPWAVIHASEQMYLRALATVSVEMLILDLIRERAARADLPPSEFGTGPPCPASQSSRSAVMCGPRSVLVWLASSWGLMRS